ncbi:MAG: type II secretion system minor pseudopilin GspI [Hyphomonadaceae bacterium]|nr:type II secretion system minor pseudopilin GspI [Hyphomonadaceae bacterium]
MTEAVTVRGRGGDREAGFSVVEALVALAVFALAGVGLVQLQTHSLQTLTRVESHALAHMVAQNRLVEAMAAQTPPEPGESTGEVENAGRVWTWRLRVVPTEDAAVRRLTVTVTESGAAAPPVAVHAFHTRVGD